MPIARCLSVLVATALTVCAQEPAKPPAPATVPAALYSTRGDEKVHLLSLPDLKPLFTYDASAGAHELAISACGRWALGSAYGGPGQGHQPADNRVIVLDLPAGKRHRMVDLGATKRPNDIAFLGTSATAVVTTEAPPQLLRLDAESGDVKAFALEHRANHMLAVAPDASACFLSHVVPGGVTRFDLATNKASAHGLVPAGAEGIACTAHGDGLQLWVACNRTDKLVVVDGRTLKVVRELDRPGFPFRVKAAPDGKRVAVSCAKSGEIAVYESADPERVTVVDLRAQLEAEVTPTSIAWSPDGKQLIVVANGKPDRIVAVDAATAKVTAKVEAAGPIADALAAGRVQVPPRGR